MRIPIITARAVGACCLFMVACGDEPLTGVDGDFSLNPSSVVLTAQNSADTSQSRATITIVGISPSGRPAENDHFDVVVGGCAKDPSESLLQLTGGQGCETRSASFLQCTLRSLMLRRPQSQER
jgi:hypothetical protein